MVPGQKRYTVKSLQLSALKIVVASLDCWERRSVGLASEDLMRIVVDFRAFADPIIHLLVEYTSFSNPLKLCVLFMYDFMKKKKVKLYGPYATQIVDLIVDFELFGSEYLRTVSKLSIDHFWSYKRDELFSKFPNLQKLRIRRGLTDKTLMSIAQHFPELTVLDGSRDFFFIITDHGLLPLVRLKKLRCLLLDPDSQERRPNPSANGLALLLTLLPELVKVSFPTFLLCDALNSLKMSRSPLLTVKSLDFGFSDLGIDILSAVSNVCPNLERLRINVRGTAREPDNEEHLSFRRLKELNIDEIFTLWNANDIYGFTSVWRQLVVLTLYRFDLELNHMRTVSEECPNLKFLAFGGDCLDDSLSLQECHCSAWPLLFPGLQIFEFLGGELRNLYFLLHKRSNLVKVCITGYDDEIYVLESLMPDHGFWPNLEIMSLTILDLNDEEVYDENLSRHLVEVFPSLNQIYVGIDRAEQDVILTSSRGNDVSVCSNVTFDLFTKNPELDFLDCLEMELID